MICSTKINNHIEEGTRQDMDVPDLLIVMAKKLVSLNISLYWED